MLPGALPAGLRWSMLSMEVDPRRVVNSSPLARKLRAA